MILQGDAFGDRLHEDLTERLDALERICAFELTITSGYREGDKRCHGTGLAVDIACRDSDKRMILIRGLTLLKFPRIGVYSEHIHADICGEPFPQNVLWYGGYDAKK